MEVRTVLDKVHHPIIEAATSVVALASVAAGFSGGVNHWLELISAEAALFMPILGAVFLAVQIYYKIAKGK